MRVLNYTFWYVKLHLLVLGGREVCYTSGVALAPPPRQAPGAAIVNIIFVHILCIEYGLDSELKTLLF